jgi:N-acetylneuraminic acid mutarotase
MRKVYAIAGGLAVAVCEAAVLCLVFAPLGWAQAGAWHARAAMPTARCCAAAAAIGGKIYVVGGFADPVGNLSTLEVYNPATDTWTEKAPMPTPRAYLGAAAFDGVLYAIGGENTRAGYTGTVEAYDPRTNTWTSKASMPTPRSMLALTVAGGELYALGGDGASPWLRTAEAYKPATNSWRALTPMPAGRSQPSATAVSGKVYVVGGNYGATVRTLFAYNPQTGVWDTETPMPTARDGLAAALVDGQIYAVGGRDGGQYTIVEAYDPATNSWSVEPPLPTGRHNLVSAVVDDTIYAIGGLGFQCCIGSEPFLATNEAFSPFLAVNIDIKPGDATNTINLKSGGVVPVAILGSATFDPMTVDPATMTLTAATDNGSGAPGGASVATRGRGVSMTATADVNHDGYPDLILYFRTQDLQLTAASTEAVLYGKTYSGTPIRGSDMVRIVPPPNAHGPGRMGPRHGLLRPNIR